MQELIRSNGKLDYLENGDDPRVDCQFAKFANDSDEMNCDTTIRFIGLYVFNFVAGITGFIMSGYLCIKLTWQATESERRHLRSIL